MDTNKYRQTQEESSRQRVQDIKSKDYPKGLPIGVSAAIKLKRCFLCGALRWTNMPDKSNPKSHLNYDFHCENCRIIK